MALFGREGWIISLMVGVAPMIRQLEDIRCMFALDSIAERSLPTMKLLFLLMTPLVIMADGQTITPTGVINCYTPQTTDLIVVCDRRCPTAQPTVTSTSTIHSTSTYYPPCRTIGPVTARAEADPIVAPCYPFPTTTLPCRLCSKIPVTTIVTTVVPTTVTRYPFCPLITATV
ncbi:hypothetical protein CPB86DRAFT_386431 [Serendipita vermifera]|nr:hypothetical protein CPB86DRAFT_386431 [Serendipita vermifera]